MKCCAAASSKSPSQASANAQAAPSPTARPSSGPKKDGAYVCPMHPEERSDAPGDCSICGMPLERLGGPSDADDAEARDLRRRATVAAVFTIPGFVWSMVEMFRGTPPLGLAPFASALLQGVLATPVVLYSGAPYFKKAFASVRARRPNMFTLIGLGVGVAYAASVAALAVPSLFPPTAPHSGPPIAFETASVVTALTLLGGVLEGRARLRATRALRSLSSLVPESVLRVAEDGRRETIAARDVRVGDALFVRAVDRVPTDGVVVDGDAYLDESLLTGEAKPVRRGVGDAVVGGSRNGASSFLMKATSVGAATTLARMVRLVEQAHLSRAPLQRAADRVAEKVAPAVLIVAALTFASWMIFGDAPALDDALRAAVAVLVVACPCAIGLAVPAATTVAAGRGARRGVLVRDAAAFEALAKTTTLVVDKTGTLTEGAPRVASIETAADVSVEEALALAAALGSSSAHPLSRAIVDEAKRRGLDVATPTDVRETRGRGVVGDVGPTRARLGSAAHLRDGGVAFDALLRRVETAAPSEASVVYVAADDRALAAFVVVDPIRPEAEATLRAFRDEGVAIVLLSGDRPEAVASIARALAIESFEAEASPERKVEAIAALKRGGAVVAMAGDGVNDAAALATADVGMAMGSGSDAAIENAPVALLGGGLSGAYEARVLGRETFRNMKQNLWLAFAYNALCIPIAAGVLYPSFGVLFDPMLAALAMGLSSVSVVANALRLARNREQDAAGPRF